MIRTASSFDHRSTRNRKNPILNPCSSSFSTCYRCCGPYPYPSYCFSFSNLFDSRKARGVLGIADRSRDLGEEGVQAQEGNTERWAAAPSVQKAASGLLRAPCLILICPGPAKLQILPWLRDMAPAEVRPRSTDRVHMGPYRMGRQAYHAVVADRTDRKDLARTDQDPDRGQEQRAFPPAGTPPYLSSPSPYLPCSSPTTLRTLTI
mmetsp:Transcript_3202/g.5595  ORF Transcript_3202/g.5595 Transcript_3202/m.5595 type:complete len:206 (+) Transcript_3202:699-1316(+)